MRPQKVYTALIASDLARSEEWYTKLFGRGPDFRPMETLVQWELNPHGGLQLSGDESLAGQGAISIVVEDIEVERERLTGLGILLGDSFEGTYSTLAKVHDPDNNLIVLVTPPSPAYPKA